MQPEPTYRISHRHLRTLVFVQVTPAQAKPMMKRKMKPLRSSNFRFEGFNDDLSEKEGQGEFIQNEFMLEQSKDLLQGPMSHSIQEFVFFDEKVEQIELKSTKQREKISEEKVIFAIIFHHELYPYDAPYITVSLKNHFPRVDDFRNYFYDIMEIDRWWPLISLQDIVQRLPAFAYDLIQSNKSQSCPDYGQFEYDVPIYREDLREISPHFLLCQLPLKQANKNPLIPYSPKLIYFTYSEILILSEEIENRLTIQKSFPLEEMTRISGTLKNEAYKLIIHSKYGKVMKIKLQLNKIQSPIYRKLTLMQLYYQSFLYSTQDIQEQSQKLAVIDLYNQIIIQAHELEQFYIADWAKSKIVDACLNLKSS